MKPTKYILLLFLSFILINNTNAQKIKSKTINSGFVFIDGKYIEPPYVVKIKGTHIYINDILVDTNSIHKYKNPPKRKKLKKLPDLPPDTLTVREAINYINPETGNNIYNDAFWYYYDKYGYNKACKLKLEFYLKTPVICSHAIQEKPYIKLVTEENDTIYIGNNIFSWEIKKRYSKRQINQFLKRRQKHVLNRIQKRLEQGGSLFSVNNIFISSGILNQEKSIHFIKEIIPIINDKTIPTENKIDLLWKKYGFVKYGLKSLIEKGIQTDNLLKYMKDGKTSKNSNYLKSYTPKDDDVVYICSYTFDPVFAQGNSTLYYQSDIDFQFQHYDDFFYIFI